MQISSLSAILPSSTGNPPTTPSPAKSTATATAPSSASTASPAPSVPSAAAPAKASSAQAPAPPAAASLSSLQASLLSTVYTTTVGGKSYSGSVEQSGGQYSVSIPNLPGASASGSSVQEAENNLNVKIDTLA